jgi:hypothetical protein
MQCADFQIRLRAQSVMQKAQAILVELARVVGERCTAVAEIHQDIALPSVLRGQAAQCPSCRRSELKEVLTRTGPARYGSSIEPTELSRVVPDDPPSTRMTGPAGGLHACRPHRRCSIEIDQPDQAFAMQAPVSG